MDMRPLGIRRSRLDTFLGLLPYLVGGYLLLVVVVALVLGWYEHGWLGGR